MSTIWEGTCQSFKKHPSGGEAVYVVFVKEKFKKDAVEAAKKELGFWDPDNSGDYQAPRMVEVKEGGEEKLSAYLASKETEGQEEINEGDEFVEELATKSEFPLQAPYALWVAVVSAGERYSSSIQLVDRSNGNKTEFGDIDSFLPYTFSSVGNAVSYALLTAVDSLNAGEIECASVMVNALLEFADDPESNFIDHYVSEMDLSDAYIMEPEEFYEEPLVIDSFDTEHPELQEAVAMCVARYRGADKADAQECYSKLVEVLRPDFEMYPLCAAVMKLKNPHVLTNNSTRVNFAEKFNPELESKTEPKPENDCPWQRFVNQLLTNTSEQDDIDPEDLEEIAAKMKGVFEEREIQLIGDDGFYSIPASELISHTNDSEMILHELMNVRKLRALMDEIVSHTAEDEPKDEPAKESKSTLRSKKQTEKHDFDIVSGDQMFCPHTFEEKSKWRVLSLGIGNSIKAHISMCVTKINGGEHAEFIGAIEQGGVFYAASESVIDPDACSTLDAAVPYAIEEIEKLINARFPNAAAAHNTLDVWKKNNCAGEWFTQYSTILKIENAPKDQIKQNEKAAEPTKPEAKKTDEPTKQGTSKAPENKPNTDGNSTAVTDDFGINGKSVKEIEAAEVEQPTNENTDDRNTHGYNERDCGEHSGANLSVDHEEPKPVLNFEEEVKALEKEWNQDEQSQRNMAIWQAAFKTDPKYTKPDTSSNTTSINAQYRQMQATRIFGARGKGWGIDVKREWIEEGMPIIINGNPLGINESVHNIEIDFWYIDPSDGQKYVITSVFGETERWYWTYNYNRLVKNSDVRKKSLTDATGKALSMLGICGDVYMGEYDDAHIETLNKNVIEADKKVRHLEEEEKIRKEVNEKVADVVEEMKVTKSKSGVNALRAKALYVIDALPNISDEQKRKKSTVIQHLNSRYNERINEMLEDDARKKAEKEQKAAQANQTAAELDAQHRENKVKDKTDNGSAEA